MTTTSKTVVRVERTTKIFLDDEEVGKLIRETFNAPKHAKVNFKTSYDLFEGVELTWTDTEEADD